MSVNNEPIVGVTQDELLHKLSRVVTYLQTNGDFKSLFVLVDSLRIIMLAQEQIIGGYYKLDRWYQENL